MKCPYCGSINDKVIDSRTSKEEDVIRRRRQCLACSRRFTTYEQLEPIQLMVIKKDGRRELFDKIKITQGLLKACEKRPISIETIEKIVNEIEKQIEHKKEVSSYEIGELVMDNLQKLDEVAYVRFASVYKQFKNIDEFMLEIKKVLSKINGG